MQPFAMEITELRALGFAEGLPIEPSDDVRGLVGVAVEFCALDGTPTYAMVPLLVEGGDGSTVATDVWSDIVRNIRRRAPLIDNE